MKITREELITSNEYWIGEIQIDLYNLIENYLKEKNITRTQFAEELGVTKGYVSQILNGEYDHKISKFVELALKVGKVPRVTFEDISEILRLDKINELHSSTKNTYDESNYFNENVIKLGISNLQSKSNNKNSKQFTNSIIFFTQPNKENIDKLDENEYKNKYNFNRLSAYTQQKSNINSSSVLTKNNKNNNEKEDKHKEIYI